MWFEAGGASSAVKRNGEFGVLKGLCSPGRLAGLGLCLAGAEIFIEAKTKAEDGRVLTAERPDLYAEIGNFGSYRFYLRSRL